MPNSVQKRSENIMHRIYHGTMALLFFAMGMAMFLAHKYQIKHLLQFDSFMRYFFGSICMLYAAFRMYRAVKKSEYA
jgi:hypothetical protein